MCVNVYELVDAGTVCENQLKPQNLTEIVHQFPSLSTPSPPPLQSDNPRFFPAKKVTICFNIPQ